MAAWLSDKLASETRRRYVVYCRYIAISLHHLCLALTHLLPRWRSAVPAPRYCGRSKLILCLLQVKKIHIPQRENPIVNRLNKTRVEKFPDLHKEKEDYLRNIRKQDTEVQRKKVSSLEHAWLGLRCIVLDSPANLVIPRGSKKKKLG